MKVTLTIIFFLFAFYTTNAQTTSVQKRSILDEKSVVRGEDGQVYPAEIWKKLIQTGKYAIKSRNTTTENGAQEWVIYQLSAEQHQLLMDRMPKPRQSDSFVEGAKFDGFKTSDINGDKYDFRKITGKIIVLNFWFINCPPCKAEIPELNNLVDQYKDNDDIIFIAIALDGKNELKDFLTKTPFNYKIIDNARYIAQKYGVKSYPTHVVIDKSGTIKFSTLGLAPNTIPWLKKSIEAALVLN